MANNMKRKSNVGATKSNKKTKQETTEADQEEEYQEQQQKSGSEKKKKTPSHKNYEKPINFRGKIFRDGVQIKPQDQAFEYVSVNGGVVIGRDLGRAKQFYVCNDWQHVYNYVFDQLEAQRDFYELIRTSSKAVKLIVDLDLTPEKLKEAEHLHTTMDAIQLEVIEVIRTKLAEANIELDDKDIDVFHSDGAEKASRHILFRVWFSGMRPSMFAFAKQDIVPALSDSAKRAFDLSIYTRNRHMRFFGNTKINSTRRLHVKGTAMQPFTDEHRYTFMRSLVQEPPPDNYETLDYELFAYDISPSKKKAGSTSAKQNVVHKTRLWDNVSDAHIDAVRFQIEKQLPEIVNCKEPEIVKENDEIHGPSLKLIYRAKSSCSRTCLFGVEHPTGNRFAVFVNMVSGTVLYYCHGDHGTNNENHKKTYLAPLKAAFRIRANFNDHTQTNNCDEDYLWWKLKGLAREQDPIQYNGMDIGSRTINLHAARCNFMKQAVPLINQCYAMLCDKKTAIVQRIVSHSIGAKPVVDYVYRDVRTIKEQLGSKKVQVKEWKMVPVKGSKTGEMYRIEYDVTFSPIEHWLESENILKYNKRVFNPRPYGMNECANAVQLNLFTGIDHPATHTMSATEMQAAADGPLKAFLDHIRYIWCANAPDAYDWVIKFLAITIAKPWVKVKVALILKSLPRTGKGVGFEKMEQIIGSKYVSMPTSIDDVTVKQFNSQFTAHCLLMILDEAFWGGSKKIKGAIKKIITETYTNVSEKYEVGYRTDACWNTIFASNEKHVVNMDIASGKMLVLDVSNKWAGASADPAAKKVYMDKVRATDVQLLSNYFHNMDFSTWNPYDLPMTNASKDQMLRSLSREHKFIYKVLNNPTVLMQNSDKTKDVRILSRTVFDRLLLDKGAVYHHYTTDCGRGIPEKPKMFWNEWKNCIPETVTPAKTIRNRTGKVCRGILLPELDVARASFCKAMYMELEFDEIDCSDTLMSTIDYEYEKDKAKHDAQQLASTNQRLVAKLGLQREEIIKNQDNAKNEAQQKESIIQRQLTKIQLQKEEIINNQKNK